MPTGFRATIAVLAAATLAIALLASCGGPSRSSSGAILFTSHSTSGWRIERISPDGVGRSDVARLGSVSVVAISADGKRVAFTRPDYRLFTMNIDGGKPTLVSSQRAQIASQPWSPDSTRIAYSSAQGVFVAGAGGKGAMRLTRAPGAGDDADPRWSADGSRIIFVRFGPAPSASENGESYYDSARLGMIHLGTVNRVQLLTTRGFLRPQWSPSGGVLGGLPFADSGGIMIQRADGKYGYTLVGAGSARAFAWSSDGSSIAFTSSLDYDAGTVTVSRSPTGQHTRLIKLHGPAFGAPAWSPDGGQIAFAACAQAGPCKLYVATVGSSAAKPIAALGGTYDTLCGTMMCDTAVSIVWTDAAHE